MLHFTNKELHGSVEPFRSPTVEKLVERTFEVPPDVVIRRLPLYARSLRYLLQPSRFDDGARCCRKLRQPSRVTKATLPGVPRPKRNEASGTAPPAVASCDSPSGVDGQP